jgi:hypothetical protein
MNADSIEDYMLATEENMKIADAVGTSWRRARGRVIKEFFGRLQNHLKKELIGWEFELYKTFFEDPYPGFYIWKPTWQEEYYLNLECWRSGEKIIFGVWRNEPRIKKRPFSGAVLAAMKKSFPWARARTWWEAEVVMHTPEPDWRDARVLWRIHSDTTFLREVAEQLLQVATVSEKPIRALISGRGTPKSA